MALSWPLVFGIMVFGLMVCPGIVFLIHLARLKAKTKASELPGPDRGRLIPSFFPSHSKNLS